MEEMVESESLSEQQMNDGLRTPSELHWPVLDHGINPTRTAGVRLQQIPIDHYLGTTCRVWVLVLFGIRQRCQENIISGGGVYKGFIRAL
jgi:hypothetical protein